MYYSDLFPVRIYFTSSKKVTYYNCRLKASDVYLNKKKYIMYENKPLSV